MDLYIKGLASNVSLSGDEGVPNVNVSSNETETVPVRQVIGNERFCTDAAAFITGSKIEVRVGSATGRILDADEMDAVKNGTLFDLDADGIADMSEGAASLIFQGLDLKDAVTEFTAVLPGNGTKRFLPIMATVICRSATALAADATLELGTSSGGGEWLSTQALGGLDAVDKALTISINTATAIASVADNATLYARIDGADSGTAGTCDVKVDGFFI